MQSDKRVMLENNGVSILLIPNKKNKKSIDKQYIVWYNKDIEKERVAMLQGGKNECN